MHHRRGNEDSWRKSGNRASGTEPISPPAIVVGPVLVTVEPATASKFAADPSGTGG